MTQLFLIRHGPTHAKTMVGWSDLPADLSDRAALARLADYVPDNACVVSSDLSRAVATADALTGERSRLPHEQDLREIHFGHWELRRFDEIEAEDPERLQAFWQDPGLVRPPGGESWGDMRARSDAAIDRLIAANDGHALVVVAHFGVILGQLERALSVPTTEVFAQKIDTLSVTELRLEQSDWTVGEVNFRP
ncbi:MAG: histidine phosphatase family protein [Pseudomonadota bacterium]